LSFEDESDERITSKPTLMIDQSPLPQCGLLQCTDGSVLSTRVSGVSKDVETVTIGWRGGLEREQERLSRLGLIGVILCTRPINEREDGRGR
jgi:hypothetical protein